MARARMIKPEVRTSEKVASWPIEVRYFWILLWGYVDDHGKAKDNARLIKADCFPLDEDVTAEVVEGWLQILTQAGVIVRYQVDDCRYLAVKNWLEHQKPQHPGKDVYPDWSDSHAVITKEDETLMKSSGESHEILTPKLSKDKLSKTNVHPEDAFEDFWTIWPRKVNKAKAKIAYRNAIKKIPEADLLAKAREYAEQPKLPELQYIPHPTSWLNGERWADEIAADLRQKPVARFGWQDERGNWIEA